MEASPRPACAVPRRIGAVLALASATTAGCSSCAERAPTPPAPSASSTAGAVEARPARSVARLLDELAGCDVEHHGVLIDAGGDALVGRLGWRWGIPAGLGQTEHDGSTWTRVGERTVEVAFDLPRPTPIFVAARLMGLSAKSATVLLDDQPLGTLALTKDQIRVAQTPTTTLSVDPGPHTITLRFTGRARDATDGYADLDWLRIGTPGEDASTYAAPTQRDLDLRTAALGGVPHRALAMRAPGHVRCFLHVPPDSRLRASIGLVGSGEGTAVVRARAEGAEPVVVHQQPVTGGDRAVWTPIDVPLGAGRLTALELVAENATRGTRVLFGDPEIVLSSPAPLVTSRAQAVVLVVLDGVERADLPPWAAGPVPSLATLSELALTGTVFDRHRGPTTVVPAVMATLLSGVAPRAHGLTDLGARLPASVTTIGTIARDASIRTAMFTGVPTTFRPFGFAQGWERFVEHAPNSGAPATAPLDDAAAWIADVARTSPEQRLLVVVHARGGHPPWDVTAKELAAVAPADYSGMMDPRRSAQVFARVRQRKTGPLLAPSDRDRARSLQAIALAGQDRALGALIAALKTAGLWDQTLFVVTGDVSSGLTEPYLFGDSLPLDDKLLALPLYVRLPGGEQGGKRLDAPTEIQDITRTALAALGLAPPREVHGRDLGVLAVGREPPWPAPQIATLADRYAARWDHLLLTGRIGAPPALCDLSVDPTCAFDRRDSMPVAARALFRRVVVHDLATAAPPSRREPATVDADTSAMLKVWGAGD